MGDHAFKATIETKIGPIKAVFDGDVQLSELDPPNGYTLSGRGSAGSMGAAKGSARVRLAANGHGTMLTYDVDADVTGKFAQLGSRLIQGTANMLARPVLHALQRGGLESRISSAPRRPRRQVSPVDLGGGCRCRDCRRGLFPAHEGRLSVLAGGGYPGRDLQRAAAFPGVFLAHPKPGIYFWLRYMVLMWFLASAGAARRMRDLRAEEPPRNGRRRYLQ